MSQRIAPNEIDTCGFPYVPGIPPIVYQNLKLPESIQECIELLKQLRHEYEDMELQGRQATYEKESERSRFFTIEEYKDWRASLVRKQRRTKQEIRVLQALADEMNKQEQQSKHAKIQESIQAQVAITVKKAIAIERQSRDAQFSHIADSLKKEKTARYLEGRFTRKIIHELVQIIHQNGIEIPEHLLDLSFLMQSKFTEDTEEMT